MLAEYDSSYDNASAKQRYFVYGNLLLKIDEVLLMHSYVNMGGRSTTGDYYYAHDHLYSVRALFNSSGAVQERALYQAYGYPDMFMIGDYDHSGMIDWGDFTIHSGAWLATSNDLNYVWEVDNNNDDIVDWGDYTRFTAHWLWEVPDDFVSVFGSPYGFTGRRVDKLDDTTDGLTLNYHRARYLDSSTGQWLTRDPLEYVDGVNLYQYVKSMPTNLMDASGFICHGEPTIIGGVYRYPRQGNAVTCQDCCDDARAQFLPDCYSSPCWWIECWIQPLRCLIQANRRLTICYTGCECSPYVAVF